MLVCFFFHILPYMACKLYNNKNWSSALANDVPVSLTAVKQILSKLRVAYTLPALGYVDILKEHKLRTT